MTKKIVLTVVAAALLAPSAWGAGLSGPFLYDSAAVLPKGIRSLRYQGVTVEAANSFSEISTPIPLGNGFNREVTYGQLLDALSPSEKAEYGGYLKSRSQDFNEGNFVGDTEGSVSARVTASVPALAYGVTDRWTVGIAIPIIYSSLTVATGFTANDEMRTVVNELARNGNASAAADVVSRMQNLVQYQAKIKGYEPIRDQEKTEMGDINLVSKYQITKTADYAWALTNNVVLPTGRRSNINKVVDIGSGDGDFKIGAGAVADYYVHRMVTLTGIATYQAQLPDQLAKRIPESRNQTLTRDIDETTYRDLGDIVRTGLSTRFSPTTEWSLLAAYSYQYKQGDRYRGAQYEPDRYGLLQENTEQTMQSAQVGVAYSTVAMYRRNQFMAPLEAGLNYTTIYDGRNVTRDSLTSLELAMYF